jgi:hypothetical protein
MEVGEQNDIDTIGRNPLLTKRHQGCGTEIHSKTDARPVNQNTGLKPSSTAKGIT